MSPNNISKKDRIGTVWSDDYRALCK